MRALFVQKAAGKRCEAGRSRSAGGVMPLNSGFYVVHKSMPAQQVFKFLQTAVGCRLYHTVHIHSRTYVRVACHNLTCGEGIFFWLWHKESPDTKWYLPAQAPANTSFCTRIFYVKARTSLFCRPTPFRCQATHTTTLSLDAWLEKSSHRYESHRKT